MKKINVITVQPWSVWLFLKKYGYFRSDLTKSHLLYEDGELVGPEFLRAYQWLGKQFQEKCEPTYSFQTNPLVWCWYKYDGKSAKKLVQKECQEFQEYRDQATIGLSIPEDKILLSDFDNWHYVMNDCYFGETEEDFGKFYARVDAGELSKSEIEKETSKSWQGIFDVSNSDYIQGVFSQIDYNDVDFVIHQNEYGWSKLIKPEEKTFN